MGHPQRTSTDAGNLVLHHEAAGREVRGHSSGRSRLRRSSTGLGPGQVQTRRVLVPDGTGRVGLVGPVAVRVEVLGSVQDPSESFEGRALGAVLRVFSRVALRVEVHLSRDHLALVVEEALGAVHALAEPRAHVVDAVHERGGGLVAGARIPAREEVGVVAVRGRVGQLVVVGRADGPELAVVSREVVDGPRLEAVRLGTRVTGTGQGGPGDAFVLAVLATACRSCRTRRRSPAPTRSTPPGADESRPSNRRRRTARTFRLGGRGRARPDAARRHFAASPPRPATVIPTACAPMHLRPGAPWTRYGQPLPRTHGPRRPCGAPRRHRRGFHFAASAACSAAAARSTSSVRSSEADMNTRGRTGRRAGARGRRGTAALLRA